MVYIIGTKTLLTMAFLKSDVFDIINNLKHEIVSYGTAQGRENLECFIEPDECDRRDNLFVRKSPLSAPILINYLLRHNPLSSQISIDEFFDEIGQKPVSKSAISQKRTRLNPEIFNYLNSRLISSCYQQFADSMKRWNGWYLMACDGSDLVLPDTDALAEYFGKRNFTTNRGRKGQSSPMAKAMMVSDILNGFTLKSLLLPQKVNEMKAFIDMLHELVSTLPFNILQSICLFDRGFFSMMMIYNLERAGLKYVIRATLASSVVRDFIDSGLRECIIEWTPSKYTSLDKDKEWRSQGEKPLTVRLVRVDLPSGETEVLATNLTATQVDAASMKSLYFMRWPIEVEFLHYKHVYEIEAFSGGRPVCVLQDFNAVVLCHNIVCLLIDMQKDVVRDECRHRKHRYKTNTAIFVGVFFSVLVDMLWLNKTEESLTLLQTTATKALTPIRDNRSYPRVRKRHKKGVRTRTKTNRKRVL